MEMLGLALAFPAVFIANVPITDDGVDATNFDLSRDGRMIAHVIERPGRPRSELWTTALDSGQGELIATNAGGPRWSFDGARLAYLRVRDHRDEPVSRSGERLESGRPDDCAPE